MNKVYIQVEELLREYGVPFDELLQLVKSGKLSLYAMKRQYEYELIIDFMCFVDDWISRKRESIKEQYYSRTIRYPDERSERIRSLLESIGRDRGREHKNFRVRDEAADRYKRALNDLEDREGIARRLAWFLYVKTSDYENIANRSKSPRKNKRQDTETRIKATREACRLVEMTYGPLLLNKSKDQVKNLVKEEMNYNQPYTATFQEWYTACQFTRKAGNPDNRKKPA